MPNTLLTIDMITREALRVLENSITFYGLINRQYDDKFARDGAKIGTIVNVRKPPRYTVSTGQALDLQDATETQIPVELTTQAHVDITFSSQDLLLSVDDFSERFIAPAIAAIANQIDREGLLLFQNVYNMIGTRGTVPNSTLTYLQGGQRLAEEAAPMDNLMAVVVTPAMQATIINAVQGLFQDSGQISKQYKRGVMGTGMGFNWFMDQNIHAHTAGLFTTGSTPLVNGAGQTGSSLITDGWAASTAILTQGDIITLASVNAVNPQHREDSGFLRQFVVTADVSSDGSGDATIPISPDINVSADDPFRTVTQSPANNAVITPNGVESANSPQGLAFHRDFATCVMADLPLPGGVDMASRVSHKKNGMSMRLVRQYDINTDQFPCRLDVLFGWAVLYPELACRIAS